MPALVFSILEANLFALSFSRFSKQIYLCSRFLDSRSKFICALDFSLLESGELHQLREIHAGILSLGEAPYLSVELDDQGRERAEPTELATIGLVWDHIQKRGRRGLNIQRYKGLGEMNADQLWETTMNPESRVLLQVRVDDAVETEEIFSVLMGDQVEPRRDFIETHALDVKQLDI